jgi:hypothetical protein
VVFKNRAQKLADRKNILAMPDFVEHVIVEPFSKQKDALLLA